LASKTKLEPLNEGGSSALLQMVSILESFFILFRLFF